MDVSKPAPEQLVRIYRQEFRTITVRRKPRPQFDRRSRPADSKTLAEWLGKGLLLDVQA
ncbi:MAG: hypothetical protein JST30_16525 [Armatimonadetes bacterium]|nr:hypothetical protein [Armatimonadota bacterium]